MLVGTFHINCETGVSVAGRIILKYILEIVLWCVLEWSISGYELMAYYDYWRLELISSRIRCFSLLSHPKQPTKKITETTTRSWSLSSTKYIEFCLHALLFHFSLRNSYKIHPFFNPLGRGVIFLNRISRSNKQYYPFVFSKFLVQISSQIGYFDGSIDCFLQSL